ncbi:3-hydroxyacyl-CoA dehydrogenase NAD-binding domain-containing protein [Variovorax paradoxus]|uniref:3-hydroxyacyl-CoA dehydrogenase NAD-binding domain-containing protein n=1 Tax=Variovorax paradoxus TaxID=34073 RepID=UPI001D17871A|nr:3-hydroxyacyl-CoA dehydrogenase NAD-binding domain-containing protein [Variovorax paradoxus]
MAPDLLPLEAIRVVGLAGAGSVGTAWAALLLAHGYEVLFYDPDAQAGTRLKDGVREAWPALRAIYSGLDPLPPLERVGVAATLEDLARGSDLVQENAGESLETKRSVLSTIDAALPANKLILSSSGGVPPSRLQEFCARPERLLLGHPFHPAYLVPLVEVVGGERTREDAVDLAMRFYTALGKHPIRLKKEMVGHLTNRLQFAVLREAIHCLSEGVASADDIDASMRWGLGLRWAMVGPLMTFNLAGGPGGIEQLIDRFRSDVEQWWGALGAPMLTDQVCEKLFAGVRELRHGISNDEWARWRDSALVELLRFRSALPYPADAIQPRQEN